MVSKQSTVSTPTMMQHVGAPTDVENSVIEMLMKFKKNELVGLCRGRNLMVSGTKLELAKRLM